MTRSPGPADTYDDTQASNDIHAVLASPARPAPGGALRDIASILARADGPPWPSRIITAAAEDDAHGVPGARIHADGTQVLIMPNGPGLLIHVTQRSQVDAETMEISVTGTVIRQPRAHGGRP